jgi:hypothetical protein
MKKYLIYWNLFANQDPERFGKVNQELPVRNQEKDCCSRKEEKTKKDNHHEMIIAEMRRGTDVEKDRLQAGLARSQFIKSAFQVVSLTKFNKEKLAISDPKKQMKLEVIANMDGDSNKKRRKNTNAVTQPMLSERRHVETKGSIDIRELCLRL